MALFCEDIREEKGGIFTLVGLMPDNVNVTALAAGGHQAGAAGETARLVGKLCVYIRINFDPDYKVDEIKLNLIVNDSEEVDLGTISIETIRSAAQKAKERGNALAGVISRAVFAGFNFDKAGPLKVNAVVNGETYLAGALNIQFNTENMTEVTAPYTP